MNTGINIYNAIMQAADHIERNPQLFDFSRPRVPDCGTPGCALGWIAHYADIKVGESALEIQKALGIEHEDGHVRHPFYNRMNGLTGSMSRWRNDASECARGMRLYAAKYHAPAKRPDSALVADLMTLVMGAKIPETANPLEVVA